MSSKPFGIEGGECIDRRNNTVIPGVPCSFMMGVRVYHRFSFNPNTRQALPGLRTETVSANQNLANADVWLFPMASSIVEVNLAANLGDVCRAILADVQARGGITDQQLQCLPAAQPKPYLALKRRVSSSCRLTKRWCFPMFKVFRHRVYKSTGFTLTELLVSLVVASIFLLATGMIVIETMRVDREETGRTQVQAELTQAMQFIQQDLAEALYIYNDAEQPNGDGTPDLIPRGFTPPAGFAAPMGPFQWSLFGG
jgi:prepilin-type N-terminal cleavage/methylation domain-containing protein